MIGAEAVLAVDRSWCSMKQTGCGGRFVPDTEVAVLQKTWDDLFLNSKDQNMSFEEWYRRVTTQSVDTEINMQLGDFTLKKHHMQLLPDAVLRSRDFIHVFGKYDPDRRGGPVRWK